MPKKFFSSDRGLVLDDAPENPGRGLGAMQKTFSDWRFRRDVAAIVAALRRLPNRRLQLIGLNQEGLFDAVCDMVLSAEENRAIGREVVAILDASADEKRS